MEKGTEETPLIFGYDPKLALVRCAVKVKRHSVNYGVVWIACGRGRPCERHVAKPKEYFEVL